MAEPENANLVPAKVIASWIDVHERTIRDLADRGIIVRAKRGVYDLQASIRKYTAHLRDIAANRTGDEATNLDLTEQRARLAKEQADQTALKNALLRGEYIDAAQAESRWADEMVKLRARMLAIAGDLPQQLQHLTPHDILVIDRAVRDAMTEASNGPA